MFVKEKVNKNFHLSNFFFHFNFYRFLKVSSGEFRELYKLFLLTGVLKRTSRSSSTFTVPKIGSRKNRGGKSAKLSVGHMTRDDVDFSLFIFLFINMYCSHPCTHIAQFSRRMSE